MSNTIIRDVLILAGFSVGTVLFLNNRPVVYKALGIDMTPPTQQTDAALTPEPKTVALSGSAVSIPKNKRDGQYWADGRVNSGHVRFLVDTGASSVALTKEDARKAGIRVSQLEYNVPISTAGGHNMAASVTLKSVSIGAITVRNVRALVVPEGLHVSLLGMTYLGELQKVEATPNALLLRY